MTRKPDVTGGRDDTLGGRLAAARKRAGMSQQAVADEIVTAERGRQTVYEWEKNKAVPSVEDLAKLCRLYRVTADSLLGLPESDEALRLQVIGKLANGSLDDEAVRRIVEAATPPAKPEAGPDPGQVEVLEESQPVPEALPTEEDVRKQSGGGPDSG